MTRSHPNPTLPAAKPLQVSALCGSWSNTDRSSAAGMLGLILAEQEGSLLVRGLGMARPVAYAWHHVRAASYALDPTSSQAWSFLADYDFGFMRTILSGYHKAGVLAATTYNTFHDGSGRTAYWTREFFHRRTLAEPTTTEAPSGISRDLDRSEAAARGNIDTATVIGRWVNFNREALGITGLTVRANGDRLAVSVDQRERDGVRHWPALSGVAVAERPGGGPAIGLVATGNLFGEQGPGPHLGTLCVYLNRGLLTIDAHVTDVQGAANVMTRTHLHLAEETTT